MNSMHWPDVSVMRMENGLEVLVVPEHSSPVASVQAWVRVGSVFEDKHLGAGMSHLVEHLVFKGTRKFGATEAARHVQDAGGYLNAYTGFERTVYWIDAPAESLATALDVTIELVFHPAFPEAEFEREKEVIRREIAMGKDDPRRALSEELFHSAFRVHPCRHPVIGLPGAFNRLTLDDVRAFHAEHYVPNNVFFVVSGAVDAETVRTLLEERAGELEPRGRMTPVLPTEPPMAGPREKNMPFATDVARLQMAWPIPAQTHQDIPALDLLGRILGSGESARLYRRLREQEGVAHDVGAGIYSPGFGGLFFAGGEGEPGQVAAMERGIRREIDAIIDAGVSEKELEKARCGALADFLRGLESTNGLASQTGASWLLTGTTDFPARYVNGLRDVGAEKVRAVAAHYLAPAQTTTVRMLPADSAVLRAGGTAARPVTPADRIHCVQLSNGTRVLLGQDARLPMVSLHAGFGGGAAIDPTGRAGLSAWLAAGLWKGTSGSSAEALAERIEGRGGSFAASSGNNTTMISLEMLADDLDMAVATLAEVVADCRFPADAMERERAAMIAAAKERAIQPLPTCMIEARRLLFKDTCFENHAQGTFESLAALAHGELPAFWKSVATARNTVIGVFGDFDSEAMVAKLEARFGFLPPGEAPVPGGSSRWREFPAAARAELMRPKEQAVLVVLFPTGGMGDPDATALELIDEASGDMGSRFFQRIREDQGLAYFIAPCQIKGAHLGAAGFYLGTSLDKIDHAEAELRDEIRRLAESGLDEAEIRRAKQTWRGKFLLQNQSADARGRHAVVDCLLGLGHDHAWTQLAAMQELTTEEIRAAAARTYGRDAVVVRVLPSA